MPPQRLTTCPFALTLPLLKPGALVGAKVTVVFFPSRFPRLRYRA